MFTLPKLPYAEDALAPHISAQTMALHHGKHHKAYIDKLNELLTGDPLEDLPLDEVIRQSHGLAARQTMFNNAAQSWNHDFFWKSMRPSGGRAPSGEINRLIGRDIGGPQAFREAFLKVAAGHFGSGWIWLVLDKDAVAIVATHDADLPPVHGRIALATCDLWEHAYYLDYQNRRPAFVETFLDHLIDWDFANANLAAATDSIAKAA
jgi:superoxide dismutase, Fe-Mn family